MKDKDILIAPIEEVADDNALLEMCDIAVCLEQTQENLDRVPSIWKDDIGYGHCVQCSTKVFFRVSTAPNNAKKFCFPCAMEEIGDDQNPVFLTRKSGADELREYLKKKEQN